MSTFHNDADLMALAAQVREVEHKQDSNIAHGADDHDHIRVRTSSGVQRIWQNDEGEAWTDHSGVARSVSSEDLRADTGSLLDTVSRQGNPVVASDIRETDYIRYENMDIELRTAELIGIVTRGSDGRYVVPGEQPRSLTEPSRAGIQQHQQPTPPLTPEQTQSDPMSSTAEADGIVQGLMAANGEVAGNVINAAAMQIADGVENLDLDFAGINEAMGWGYGLASQGAAQRVQDAVALEREPARVPELRRRRQIIDAQDDADRNGRGVRDGEIGQPEKRRHLRVGHQDEDVLQNPLLLRRTARGVVQNRAVVVEVGDDVGHKARGIGLGVRDRHRRDFADDATDAGKVDAQRRLIERDDPLEDRRDSSTAAPRGDPEPHQNCVAHGCPPTLGCRFCVRKARPTSSLTPAPPRRRDPDPRQRPEFGVVGRIDADALWASTDSRSRACATRADVAPCTCATTRR